jgi:glycine/D-amino acid oxidase-like deaminating enzyme
LRPPQPTTPSFSVPAADLALHRHGAEFIEPELNVALVTSDGRALALEAAVRETDGEIRLLTELQRIVVEGQRPIGVETAQGEFIAAKYLITSSLNPQQTFLDLLDPPYKVRNMN